MRLRTVSLCLLSGMLWLSSVRCPAAESPPAPGTHGHYAVLTATPHRAAPFAAVDVTYGPREEVEGVSHPRRSIYGPPEVLDKAILIPYGYFPPLRNLWWVRVLDPEGKNEASRGYRRLMQDTLRAYHQALDQDEDFDFVIDTGAKPTGYRKIVRIGDGAR